MLNHNLPPRDRGVAFQEDPSPIHLGRIQLEHEGLWQVLDRIDEAEERARLFHDYVVQCHLFHEERSKRPPMKELNRHSYGSLLRGWGYDSDGRSGEILRGWAQHRFGLRPIFYGATSETRLEDAENMVRNAYGVNLAHIYTQLDLLYTFCQKEFIRNDLISLTLFRGTHDAQHYCIKNSHEELGKRQELIELNCLSSFTKNPETAWEFGSCVWKVQVPCAKIMYYSGLMPQGWLASEQEYLVLGGDYRVRWLLG